MSQPFESTDDRVLDCLAASARDSITGPERTFFLHSARPHQPFFLGGFLRGSGRWTDGQTGWCSL